MAWQVAKVSLANNNILLDTDSDDLVELRRTEDLDPKEYFLLTTV